MSQTPALLASAPATVQGVAGRIPAAKQLEVKAAPAVLRATIQITRAETGKVEEYEIVGTAAEITEGA
jgi:hypothetical protein